MTMREFSLIVAVHFPSMGIGCNGALPWKIPEDMARFQAITSAAAAGKVNAVIMGRKTWGSIPAKFRPLKGRKNVVLSRSPEALELPEGTARASSLSQALEQLGDDVDQVFIIGGEALYREALASSSCRGVHLTEVQGTLPRECDAFFPALPATRYTLTQRTPWAAQESLSYRFADFSTAEEVLPAAVPGAPPAGCSVSYESNPEEGQYLELIRRILERGVLRGDRTGTGTLSLFGESMRFSLRGDRLPLVTTKKVFWRAVAEEMLWFIRGSTNANELAAKGVHIWDGNGTREFLDSRGLTANAPGDLGPVYGFQWRHFGAAYTSFDADYTSQGVDQLQAVVQQLRTNPSDRRIVLSAWNPAALPLMALPPCHMFCQFYAADGELSCSMYQRSADMGLGVPFNIASYALLTRLVAHAAGLRAGELVHVIGDAHIYCNHVDALREQLLRAPRPFPTLSIRAERAVGCEMDDFRMEDLALHGYDPHGPIKMKMAV